MNHKSRTVEPYFTIQMCRHSTTFRYLARKPPPLWTLFILSFPATHTNTHLSFYLCSFIYSVICCGLIFPKLVFDVRFTVESWVRSLAFSLRFTYLKNWHCRGSKYLFFLYHHCTQNPHSLFIVFELCQISTLDPISDFVSNPETELTQNRTKYWFSYKFDSHINTGLNRKEGRKILPFNDWCMFLKMFFDFAWHFMYNSRVIRKGLNGYTKKCFRHDLF
jgi:hypothetical protein